MQFTCFENKSFGTVVFTYLTTRENIQFSGIQLSCFLSIIQLYLLYKHLNTVCCIEASSICVCFFFRVVKLIIRFVSVIF